MELRHLRYFVAVAQELHFGRAAQKLAMAQPPLSQQIQQLEDELGVKLFERTKRHVELTPAGQLFLEQVQSILAQLEQASEAARRVGRGEVGRLEIGYVYSATLQLLPPFIEAFREQYKDIQLELYEKTTLQQLQALEEKRIQLGFIRGPLDEAVRKRDDLEFEVIAKEHLLVALSHNHPLAALSCVPLKELANESLIIFPRYTNPGHYEQIITLCREAGFIPHVSQELAQLHTILGLVAVGMGMAFVPSSAQTLGLHGVVCRELDVATPVLELVMVWRKDNFSPVLKAFLNLTRHHSPLFTKKSLSYSDS